MAHGPMLFRNRRRFFQLRLLLALVATATILALSGPSNAQQVAALVNGEPITELDISQRIRLLQLSAHKAVSRQEALDELIDEKLKLRIAQRYTVEITDREVNSTFAGIARRSGASTEQFAQALSKAGLSVDAVKTRIKADIGWAQIIRSKYQGSLQVGEKDVTSALQGRGQTDAVAYDYRLRPILLIVARGSPPNVYEARRAEAESIRSRFQSCQEGMTLVAGLRDVAIREMIGRSSVDLPAPQREALDKVPLGHLTPPETTQQGIEMFAVCGKEPAKGDTPGRRQLIEQIAGERFQKFSKQYLEELRRGALIEIR
jgi:peptidyl-prolyl cis-trans isomerase SurA